MIIYSIIVPTFNSGYTLKRCLDSILSQTFKSFEIIIADGLSTDSTIMIAQSMRDERVKVYSEKDYGVYDAMNKSVERAKGKWILFLGSDDYLVNNFVLEEICEKLALTNSKIVYGSVNIVGDTSWANDGDIYMGEISIPQLFQFNICHQCIFYDALIFKKKQFNLHYPICADHDMNLYIAAKYGIEYCPIVVATFVSGGISTNFKDISFEQDRWLNIISYFNENLLDKDFIKYRIDIKRTISTFIKRFEIYYSFLAIRIFIYLTFKSLMIKLNN